MGPAAARRTPGCWTDPAPPRRSWEACTGIRRATAGRAGAAGTRTMIDPRGSAADADQAEAVRRSPASELVMTTVVPSGLGVAEMSPKALINVEPRPRSML